MPQRPFPPFVELFGRVLGLHPALADPTGRRARFMAEFAVGRLRLLGQGRTAQKNLFDPLMTALADAELGIRLAPAPPGDRERLAAAALPMFSAVREGSMDVGRAAALFADFAAAVRTVDRR